MPRVKSSVEALFALSLLAVVSIAAACSGGGGGGGGDDDDDDVLPTPERPGFVVMRLDTMLSIAAADGSTLVDLTAGPNGEKSLVGFTDDDRVLYLVKPAVSSTAGDLWIVGVDGTGNQLLAADVYGVNGWADATHLLFTRGPGPDCPLATAHRPAPKDRGSYRAKTVRLPVAVLPVPSPSNRYCP